MSNKKLLALFKVFYKVYEGFFELAHSLQILRGEDVLVLNAFIDEKLIERYRGLCRRVRFEVVDSCCL